MKPDYFIPLPTEKALKRISAAYSTAMHVTKHRFCFTTHPVPNLIEVSEGVEDLLGFSAKQCLQDNFLLKQVHADDQDVVDRLFHSVYLSDIGFLNLRIRHADGRIRCLRGEFERDSSHQQLILKLQDSKMLCCAQLNQTRVENFESMMDNIDDFICFKDRNHVYTGASRTLASLIDTSANGMLLIGKTDYDIFPEAYADVYYKLEKQVFSHVLMANEVQAYVGACGKTGWMNNRKYPMLDVNGELIGLFSVSRDITQFKQFEDSLLVAAAAFEAQEAIVVTDAQGVVVRVNQAFSKAIGYDSHEVIGSSPALFCGTGDFEMIWNQLQHYDTWVGEVSCICKNGESVIHHFSITNIKNPSEQITNYVITMAEFLLTKAAADEIKSLAFYDPLTKLPNRRLLLDRLKRAMTNSARHQIYGALLFLDLDHFKTLNDSLGHHIGDLFLQKVAERLSYCLRESDTIGQIGRLGGDEFVVMLENLSANETDASVAAELVASKVLNVLSQPYYLSNNEYITTVSIGVALFKGHDDSQQDLLRHADIAMYQAKKSGRNGVCFFDPKVQQAINHRIELERELRKALQKQELQLYYQAQVNHQQKILGVEALIRWKHPEKGMIAPGDFIPIAEETGLVLEIGQWVLESACLQLQKWQASDEASALTISINVSAKQFRHEQFVFQVANEIRKHGIDPSKLKLELTESLLLENVDAAIRRMHELREIGILMALDDFGTGYSSLQYLKKLPLHQLKIDRSFVRDIESDPNDKAIVRTIVAIAESMNLEVIAEGVETEAQQNFLTKIGCKQYQGFFFGKPIPIEIFELSFLKPVKIC